MPDLPDLMAPERRLPAGARSHVATTISLKGYPYQKAMAIPGAIYDPETKGVILPAVTPRAAIVALQLFPNLGSDYPELIEARDSQLQDVSPTDYATPLGIEIDAPYVHQTLLDDGHDWLTFPCVECGEAGGYGPDWCHTHADGPAATQSTDLGYAAAILAKHGAFYLGWARGYGKTLGTCAIIEANGYKSVLIAVPNTAKQDVWVRELEKRNRTHTVLVMGNDEKKRLATIEAAVRLHAEGTPFILVVHHEAVALIAGKEQRASEKGWTVKDGWTQGICERCGDLYARTLKRTADDEAICKPHRWSKMPEWDLFVVDEVHRLKSSGRNGSQLHRAAGKVPCKARLGLSGSVYENNWEEVYGPLHWLYPARYHDKWDSWSSRFLDYVEGAGGHGKICVGILEGREQAMRDELGVLLIVREKPDKSIAMQHFVDLSPKQRKAYEELQNDFYTRLDDGTNVLAMSGLSMLTRLRQIASGLELLGKDVVDSTKLDAAMQIISDYEDFDDFFVACWYKASAYALADRLRMAGTVQLADNLPEVFVITGDVPMTARTEIIQASRDRAAEEKTYRDGSRRPVVLIGTIPTLGESANLQHLNHVIRIDRSFNPALNRQVVDRCDRTGQEREVRLSDIIARDTVDELVVMPNLANKDAFRALVLGRGA